MRLNYLLLPLTLTLLAMTSGCHHHRNFYGGGYGGGCCCSPCNTCCGYTPSVEGPMPPLAAPAGSIMVPQTPIIGSR